MPALADHLDSLKAVIAEVAFQIELLEEALDSDDVEGAVIYDENTVPWFVHLVYILQFEPMAD